MKMEVDVAAMAAQMQVLVKEAFIAGRESGLAFGGFSKADKIPHQETSYQQWRVCRVIAEAVKGWW